MRQSKDYTLLALAIPFFMAVGCEFGISKSIDNKPVVVNNGHTCRWDKCPYKGVLLADAKEAIIEYTGSDEGSDSYCVDMLHIEQPSLDYDQIDSVLFSPMKSK